MADQLEQADDDLANWRGRGLKFKEGKARRREFLEKARALLPPVEGEGDDATSEDE